MTRGSPIPTRSRLYVKRRDGGRCVRCRRPLQVTEWHHRRSRSVVDEHQHSPCNGVSMCTTCHRWTHGHPFEARSKGLIVARHAVPCETPLFITAMGWVMPAHDEPEFVRVEMEDTDG